MFAPSLKPFGSGRPPSLGGLIGRVPLVHGTPRKPTNPPRFPYTPYNTLEQNNNTQSTYQSVCYSADTRYQAFNFWASSTYMVGRVEVCGYRNVGSSGIYISNLRTPLGMRLYSSNGNGVQGASYGAPGICIAESDDVLVDDPDSTAPLASSWISFRLREPVQLVSGTEYFVVLYAMAPPSQYNTAYFRIYVDRAAGYLPDHARYSSANGASWSLGLDGRYMVRTFSAGNPFLIYQDFADNGIPANFIPYNGCQADFDEDSKTLMYYDSKSLRLMPRSSAYMRLDIPTPLANWTLCARIRAANVTAQLLGVYDSSGNELFSLSSASSGQHSPKHGTVAFNVTGGWTGANWTVWADFTSATGGLANGTCNYGRSGGTRMQAKPMTPASSTTVGTGQGDAAYILLYAPPTTGNTMSVSKLIFGPAVYSDLIGALAG